jgi:multimeric flavodoxin WrbA
MEEQTFKINYGYSSAKFKVFMEQESYEWPKFLKKEKRKAKQARNR